MKPILLLLLATSPPRSLSSRARWWASLGNPFNIPPTIDTSLGVGMVGGVKALILLLVVVCVGCGGSTEKVAPKSQADSKAAGFDEMETLREKMEKLSEKAESLNETERLELTFNRINNYTSILEKAMEIAEQNSTDAKATSKVNNPESPKAAPEKLIADPIVEKAIRYLLKKPTGEFTKADLEKVTELSLFRTQITDAGLKEVAKLQQLKELGLADTQITNAGLMEVAKLQQLTYLNLSNTEITDAGLKEVAKLQQLITFGLFGTQITDAGLKEVAKLQNLIDLNLSNTKITGAGLKELAKLPKLEALTLYGTQMTNAHLMEVAKFTKLTTLNLGSTQISDAGLKDMAKLQQLEWLYLNTTKVTKEGVAELQKALPNCTILSNPTK